MFMTTQPVDAFGNAMFARDVPAVSLKRHTHEWPPVLVVINPACSVWPPAYRASQPTACVLNRTLLIAALGSLLEVAWLRHTRFQFLPWFVVRSSTT
jgi:hypothetical protein